MRLKPMEETDRTDFLEMCMDFYADGAALQTIPPERMERSFEKAVSGSPYIKGFLFLEGETAVGYALTFPYYSNEVGGLCLMLDEIYVKPEWRRRGLASQYLAEVAQAFDEPVVGLRLDVCPDNDNARRLYEKQGFQMLGYQSMVKGLMK